MNAMQDAAKGGGAGIGAGGGGAGRGGVGLVGGWGGGVTLVGLEVARQQARGARAEGVHGRHARPPRALAGRAARLLAEHAELPGGGAGRWRVSALPGREVYKVAMGCLLPVEQRFWQRVE